MDRAYKCVTCERVLRRKELDRYDQELAAWARQHPQAAREFDPRDVGLIGFSTGVRMDCDACAVERLRFQKQIEESRTFMDRVAAGGPEGFWVVAVVILAILAFCVPR